MTSFSRRDLAKGGMALAGGALVRPRPARAAAKVRLLTNWFAEAEHGGFRKQTVVNANALLLLRHMHQRHVGLACFRVV